MNVLVSGASGLVGAALVSRLELEGRTTTRLVRRRPADMGGEIRWTPDAGELSPANLEGIDAVVHLAGENIASSYWFREKKRKIRDSRVEGTRLLCKTLASLDHPPSVIVGASAIGYYGSRGDESLDEASGPGEGFLADVCKAWEAATAPATERGIRVVNFRLGVVLSGEGGPLKKMLLPFRLGVGGVVGSGKQYMSWIGLRDAVRAIGHCLDNDSITGPVNAASQNPVTNREFTKTLGKVLRRPTCCPIPGFVARLALGEMAEELLLSSARVAPERLTETGFVFETPNLEETLRTALGR